MGGTRHRRRVERACEDAPHLDQSGVAEFSSSARSNFVDGEISYADGSGNGTDQRGSVVR